jgi:hypothetical protein
MKRRQVSSHLLEHTITSECLKISAMLAQTFCRMIKAALKDQVGRNVLSYVDDIVIAWKKKDMNISDLAETFRNMHEARLELNPEKMHILFHKGQGSRVFILHERHRSKP